MFNGEVIEDYFQPAGGASKLSKRRRLHSTTTSDNREEGHQREPQRPAVEKQKQQDSDTRGTPRHGYEYSPVYLGELKAGPQRINFTARIVNIYDVKNTYAAADSTTTSGSGGRKRGGRGAKKSEEATATMPTSNARGCLKILAKDDSGCILVRYYIYVKNFSSIHHADPTGRLFSASLTFDTYDLSVEDQSVVRRTRVRRRPRGLPRIGLDNARFSAKGRIEEDRANRGAVDKSRCSGSGGGHPGTTCAVDDEYFPREGQDVSSACPCSRPCSREHRG